MDLLTRYQTLDDAYFSKDADFAEEYKKAAKEAKDENKDEKKNAVLSTSTRTSLTSASAAPSPAAKGSSNGFMISGTRSRSPCVFQTKSLSK